MIKLLACENKTNAGGLANGSVRENVGGKKRSINVRSSNQLEAALDGGLFFVPANSAPLPIVLVQTMPKIMIRCPIVGIAVPTGLTTETIKFESLSSVTIPLRCPACRKLHKWEQKDAWVEKYT